MKRKLLILTLGISLLLTIVGSVGCRPKQGGTDSHEDSQYDDDEHLELSVEEANRLMAKEVDAGCPSTEEMFDPFRVTNLLLNDSTAPHNVVGEPLMSFAEHFSNDISFQKSRTRLIAGSTYIPDYDVGLLQILLPDSTNFFASWSEIEQDHAAFCNGWLGSEMNKEYVFGRGDDGKWYLVDFFSAIKEY